MKANQDVGDLEEGELEQEEKQEKGVFIPNILSPGVDLDVDQGLSISSYFLDMDWKTSYGGERESLSFLTLSTLCQMLRFWEKMRNLFALCLNMANFMASITPQRYFPIIHFLSPNFVPVN